jgi:hypothetical protein
MVRDTFSEQDTEDTEEKRRHEDAKEDMRDCGDRRPATPAGPLRKPVAYFCELCVCALRVLRSAVYFAGLSYDAQGP